MFAKVRSSELESAHKFMATKERQVSGSDDSRRTVIITVAVISAIVIAILFYFLMRASSGGGTTERALEGAILSGSPEFAEYQSKIVLDPPEAEEAKRVVGDIWMNLHTTVRNFTGRTLRGLEIRGSVIDHQGKPVKQRTMIVLPNERVAELEPNKTMTVEVFLEGLTDTDDRANIRMEVTGFKFK